MPRSITTLAYKYAELTPDAQTKAREWYREGADFDATPTLDDAKTILEFMGWHQLKVSYSGFSSQGDGASFTGRWSAQRVDARALATYAPQDAELIRIAAQFAMFKDQYSYASGQSERTRHGGGYVHDKSTNVTANFGEYLETLNDGAFDAPMVGKPMAQLLADAAWHEVHFVETSRDMMRWIYKNLEAEYDYQNSDEQVTEAIEANEYEFTAEGKRI